MIITFKIQKFWKPDDWPKKLYLQINKQREKSRKHGSEIIFCTTAKNTGMILRLQLMTSTFKFNKHLYIQLASFQSEWLSYLCQRIEKLLGKRNSRALNSAHAVRHRSHNSPNVQFFIIKLNLVRSFSRILLPAKDVDPISHIRYTG